MQQSSQKPGPQRLLILFAFACVYIFWGSTYIAIKIAGEYLPALLLAGVRFLISGALMLGYCRLRGLRLLWNPRQMAWLALFGVLLLGAGNVGLIWAEKFLATGLASLLVAIVPLYVALIEYFSAQRRTVARARMARAVYWLRRIGSPALAQYS